MRRGFILHCCQLFIPWGGDLSLSIMHSVAVAVMIGFVVGVVSGVKPPSTAINRGDVDRVMLSATRCRFLRVFLLSV